MNRRNYQESQESGSPDLNIYHKCLKMNLQQKGGNLHYLDCLLLFPLQQTVSSPNYYVTQNVCKFRFLFICI